MHRDRCPYLTHIKIAREDIRRVCSLTIDGSVDEEGRVNLFARVCPCHIRMFRECLVYQEAREYLSINSNFTCFIPED